MMNGPINKRFANKDLGKIRFRKWIGHVVQERRITGFREEADEPYGFVTYGDFFSEISKLYSPQRNCQATVTKLYTEGYPASTLRVPSVSKIPDLLCL